MIGLDDEAAAEAKGVGVEDLPRFLPASEPPMYSQSPSILKEPLGGMAAQRCPPGSSLRCAQYTRL